MKSILPLITACALLHCAVIPTANAAGEKGTAGQLFELRKYHANPGKLNALQVRFRDHTMKLFKQHGMVNVAYWVPKKNTENLLIYLLSYPDRKAREMSWKAFLADPRWKAAYKASIADGRLINKVDHYFLTLTSFSPEFVIKQEDPPRLFELRQYTTNEGKLPALHARFRDHTIQLFEKHGLSNIAYFQMTPGQDMAKRTLIYLLAHKDEDSRNANFKAFGKDPAWIAARDESEKDGKLLIKKGVQSTLLIPTDYSPTK